MQFVRQIYDDLPDFIPIPDELKHSKAEVIILPLETNEIDTTERKTKHAAFFTELRQRHIKISSEIDINQLMNEMNDGLC